MLGLRHEALSPEYNLSLALQRGYVYINIFFLFLQSFFVFFDKDITLIHVIDIYYYTSLNCVIVDSGHQISCHVAFSVSVPLAPESPCPCPAINNILKFSFFIFYTPFNFKYGEQLLLPSIATMLGMYL